MNLDDPFPVENFPPRVRTAILAEFHGRHPTVLEVVRLPDTHWLGVPTMGPATLAKLRDLTRDLRKPQTSPLSDLTADELLAQRDRLQAKLRRIREYLRANTAELRMRGISPDSRRVTGRGKNGLRAMIQEERLIASSA